MLSQMLEKDPATRHQARLDQVELGQAVVQHLAVFFPEVIAQ